jgi:hypothetical protein
MEIVRMGKSVLLAVLMTSYVAAACVPVPPLESQRSWTAPPITAGSRGTQEAGTTGANAATRPAPVFTPRPTRTPTRRPSPSPTLDPHHVVITEDDVRRSVAAGAAAQGGAQVEGLNVRFTNGKMRITADSLRYGVVNVSDLILVGQLFARNGQLQMTVESVQPGGLVGAFIPSVVNQALARYASQWYVEDVRTLEGRLELQIR